MNFITYRKSDGRVITATGAPDGTDVTAYDDAENGVLVVAELPDINNSKVVNGAVYELGSNDYVSERLTLALTEARREIKHKISAARQNYITDLPGQDAIYQAKRNEAEAFKVDASPNMSDYPFLSSEVGITAPTADDLADLWLVLAPQWTLVAAALEGARMTATSSLASATTLSEVESAMAAFEAAIGNI